METSVSESEVARFDRLARQWWDRRGPMQVLHNMNPCRISWIADRLPPGPLRVLDVGCGGGVAAEALARLGHDVLGIDAAPEAVAVARAHAQAGGLAVAYAVTTAEALRAEGRMFDAVVALEVIEHVSNPGGFARSLAALTRPGGRVFVSTLNRTARSFGVAILGAEYLARLLPRGTHDWRRFVMPEELAALLRTAGLRIDDTTGLAPDLTGGGWRPTRDLGVNYLVAATR